ncbi:MAG TPA: hypothetical protein VF533_12035 [Solirubrobacteraceae bacterium]|jgi:recombinational DNA repair protein (RecF pathway)
MAPPLDTGRWHSCAGCRKPVDAHLALELKSASWLCRPCAQSVAKELASRKERTAPLGPMQPTFG